MPDDKEKISDKIGKFFKKKKNEAKFKMGMTGPGHRLGDTSSASSSSPGRGTPPPAQRVETSREAKQAGAAALARFEKKDNSSVFGTYVSAQ
jgi:UBX domain-containing protein 6